MLWPPILCTPRPASAAVGKEGGSPDARVPEGSRGKRAFAWISGETMLASAWLFMLGRTLPWLATGPGLGLMAGMGMPGVGFCFPPAVGGGCKLWSGCSVQWKKDMHHVQVLSYTHKAYSTTNHSKQIDTFTIKVLRDLSSIQISIHYIQMMQKKWYKAIYILQ